MSEKIAFTIIALGILVTCGFAFMSVPIIGLIGLFVTIPFWIVYLGVLGVLK